MSVIKNAKLRKRIILRRSFARFELIIRRELIFIREIFEVADWIQLRMTNDKELIESLEKQVKELKEQLAKVEGENAPARSKVLKII